MAQAENIGKLVLIGGSAGSLEVLLRILPELPADTRYPIVIIVHRKASADNTLSQLMESRTTLRIEEIEDKQPLQRGTLHIAPGGYHVLFERDGSLALDCSEKVAFSRPSIDVAFQSAAGIYGTSLTAILLSGANADGTEGLKEVRDAGGVAVVQSPQSARMPFMPQHAIDEEAADLVLGIDEITALLRSL